MRVKVRSCKASVWLASFSHHPKSNAFGNASARLEEHARPAGWNACHPHSIRCHCRPEHGRQTLDGGDVRSIHSTGVGVRHGGATQGRAMDLHELVRHSKNHKTLGGSQRMSAMTQGREFVRSD